MNNIELQLAPAPGACLSSGFGQRSGRVHKGLDYYSKPAVAVIAAADGKVIAVKFRAADYGNWVIIDHGEGVYTSYAHLANVEGDITSGAVVKRGQVLGMMGNSGDATSAIHLHYEVATGDYNNPKAWFGLTPRDPFRLAARCG
jgi:murein DD-endopeptidase MepM/ murein hydrolase activator NlpD